MNFHKASLFIGRIGPVRPIGRIRPTKSLPSCVDPLLCLDLRPRLLLEQLAQSLKRLAGALLVFHQGKPHVAFPVVPEADPEGLLKPKAFVVLRADVKTDGLQEDLKEHVKQKIGVWKYPRWIEVVDALPKTATGKIQRFKLREDHK